MAQPQIGLDIDRMVLLQRDMNGAKRTRHDCKAACGKFETRPRLPLGDRPGDDHVARRDFDHLRAAADMGADPRHSLVTPAQAGAYGPTAPSHGCLGKALQLLEKRGAAEPWVPAFAGKSVRFAALDNSTAWAMSDMGRASPNSTVMHAV